MRPIYPGHGVALADAGLSKPKNYISIYDPFQLGSLSYVKYAKKKGTPRPGWTYRSARRNAAKSYAATRSDQS